MEDPRGPVETLPPVGDELRCQPVLLQTIHAAIDIESLFYIEPGRDIFLHPPAELSPDEIYDHGDLWDVLKDYIFYEGGKDHPYRRLPDGRLTERLSPDEPDHAREMDTDAISSFMYTLYPPVIGIDVKKNIYVSGKKEICVYTPEKKPLAKFKVLGGEAVQYLAEDGCFCVVTNNGGMERKRTKNLLRVYRLELPEQNEKG